MIRKARGFVANLCLLWAITIGIWSPAVAAQTDSPLVVSLALVVDRSGRTVRVGLGSVAPAPLRAAEAEAYIGGHLDWDGGRPPSAEVVDRFTELVVGATSPIDDHRGSARYRRHAVGVLAGRALARAVGMA